MAPYYAAKGGISMIFEMKNREFESEKERNLYFKFFAGFYSNELIPGYAARVKSWYSLMRNPAFSVGDLDLKTIRLVPEAVHVSFDNHTDRFSESQRGEFADIMIHDQENSLLIGIEAKYLDDWEYQKDIVQNEDKLGFMGKKLGAETTVPCLLLTRTKWDNVRAQENQAGSNYSKLKEHPGRAMVPLWESFLDLESVDPRVKEYLRSRLRESNPRRAQ